MKQIIVMAGEYKFAEPDGHPTTSTGSGHESTSWTMVQEQEQLMTTLEQEIDYKAREHQWAEALREPHRVQTTGHLADVYLYETTGEVVVTAQCCLDVACEKAGLPLSLKHGNQGLRSNKGPGNDTSDLPLDAQTWLGVTDANPKIDVPSDLRTQGCDEPCLNESHEQDGDYYCDGPGWLIDSVDAITLNDDLHFTFSQIADLVDYFGLVR